MEVWPSEYQNLELSRDEKVFLRNILSGDQYGYLMLNTNPAMLPNESMHTLVCSDGVLFFKFFSAFTNATLFTEVIPQLINSLYKQTVNIISTKLISNKALLGTDSHLRFPVNIIYVFPALEKELIKTTDVELQLFIQQHCLFKEDMMKFRTDFSSLTDSLLQNSIIEVSTVRMKIIAENVNSILQRITPEYVTIRVSAVANVETSAGADNELLVVTEDDAAVKAYRLDKEQINIVNKINKGDQLILACAGSGKSVLLIAKCFKAATMNPDKSFLITCYNKNLYSLYTWFIDRAGLKAKNVTCMTFHTLCRRLLEKNHLPVYTSYGYSKKDQFDRWASDAIMRFNAGQIPDRYYGIFIDEVQQFNPEWYKFCYNLLENKSNDDHLFVICGDKTQKLANLQRHGRAPWNAGEGYPNYRGGNKSIRIEKNYRNCIEINEYINRYVSLAKKYLVSIDPDTVLDPDEFLRGKSFFQGEGVTLKYLAKRSNHGEAQSVIESIQQIHNEKNIPYDEIAVIMYNGSYKKKINGWYDWKYNLEEEVLSLMENNDVPYCQMYSTDNDWGAMYGDDGGVRIIKFMSVLGLDFRAAIVCGLPPFGEHDKTKLPKWEILKDDGDVFDQAIEDTKNNIRLLYVACTRAKEILHIILPETGTTSVYVKMLEEAE